MMFPFADDHANEDPRFLAVGSAASWYCYCGFMYCWRNESARRAAGDPLNFIPELAAPHLFPDKHAAKHIKALVEAGLWIRVDGGYALTGYRPVGSEPGASAAPLPDRPPAPALPPVSPTNHKPSLAKLGGAARASQASRGPAGKFQPAGPATANRLDQPQPAGWTSHSQPAGPSHSQPAGPSHSQPAGPAADQSNQNPSPEEEEENTNDLLHLLPPGEVEGTTDRAREAGDQPAGVQLARPRNLREALTIEVGERARIVLSMNTEAYFLEPHAWPEVLKVFDLFGAGWKKELGRPGPWDRDPGTRAAVSLLACFTLEQIARVAENIDRNPVIRQGNRALACVSPEVARRTLSGDFGAAGGRRNEPVQQNNTDPFSKHEVVR